MNRFSRTLSIPALTVEEEANWFWAKTYAGDRYDLPMEHSNLMARQTCPMYLPTLQQLLLISEQVKSCGI